MRKYWEIAKSQIQLNTAYSAWYWAGTFSAIVRLLIIYYFWYAVYENKTTIADLSLHTILTYMVIAFFLEQYVTGVGQQLAHSIRDGSIAIELLRPYDYLLKLVALDVGDKIAATVRQTLPLLIIAFLFLDVQPPSSLTAGILFAISTVLAIFIGAQFDLFFSIFAFWTINVWGLRVLKGAVITFFSGALIPISFFPDWLQTLSQFLPFQYMVYVPVSIYTGTFTGIYLVYALLLQIFWLIALYGIVRLFWAFAIRKITIFGG
jgi:ABC-2 type transport system permease protein